MFFGIPRRNEAWQGGNETREQMTRSVQFDASQLTVRQYGGCILLVLELDLDENRRTLVVRLPSTAVLADTRAEILGRKSGGAKTVTSRNLLCRRIRRKRPGPTSPGGAQNSSFVAWHGALKVGFVRPRMGGMRPLDPASCIRRDRFLCMSKT